MRRVLVDDQPGPAIPLSGRDSRALVRGALARVKPARDGCDEPTWFADPSSLVDQHLVLVQSRRGVRCSGEMDRPSRVVGT